MEQFWDAKCGLYQLKRIGNHNVLFVRSKIDAYPNGIIRHILQSSE